MAIKSPNAKGSFSLVNTVFGCLIAGIIFGILLIIFKHPIKYSFYVFSLTLAGLLFFIIFRYRDGFEIAVLKPVRLVDCVMIIFASITLFSNFIVSYSSEVTFLAALIVLFFLPGWALLRALGLDRVVRSNIELFVLSFSLSVIMSALILLSGLFFQADSVALNKFVTLVFFAISIIPFITRWWISRKESVPYIKVRYNYSELLCITWLSIFFIFVIWNLYPGMAYVPGYDLVRHYSYFKQVFQAPDIYYSIYPWFYFQWALLDQISLHPTMELMQSGLAMMSIIVIFSFYVMARSYLVKIDSRAPMIATILFTAFSGLGWIYFLQQAGTISDLNQEWDALIRSQDVSYNDIGTGGPAEIWLWFRPLTLGFALLFVLLYLLNSKELSKPIYIAITSALVVALMQIHISELMIFVLLIWVTALFFPSIKLRTKEAAISILIGITCSSILSYSYSYILSPRYASEPLGIYISALIAVLAGTSLIFLRKTERIKFGSLKINWNLVIAFLGAAYLILLLFWNSISDNFKQESVVGVYGVYGVPWEFYPLLLGIVGLLAIPGIIIILKNSRNHPVVIFVALFLLTMVLGRALTFLYANSISTEYWERRLIPIMQASASVVASVVILQIVRWLEGRNQRSSYAKRLKSLLPFPILSILILAGSLSTFSTFEFQTLNIDMNSLTDVEKAQSPFGRFDPYTTILTESERSRRVAEVSPAGYVLSDNRDQLWSSQSPELPLKFLYGLNYSAVVYLRPFDLMQINEKNYADKYIASHLLNMSIPYNDSSVGTHQLPKLVPVASKSDMVLVVPENVDRQFYYAYDILSGSGYNYTTAVQSDINSIGKARIIIAPSETIGSELIRHKKDYDLRYEYLIILNLEGYGKISRPAPSSSSPMIDLGSNRKWTPMTTIQDLIYRGGSTAIGELNTTSDFAYMQEGDSDTIYYFNLLPLVQNLDSNGNVSGFYKMLGEIMGTLSLPLEPYEFNNRSPHSLTAGRVGAFENVTFMGDLSIKSTSAIVRPSGTAITVRINGHDSKLENVSQIIPINSSSVIIHANKGIMFGASGFYSNVSLDQSLISFSGQPVRLMLKNSVGNQTSEITANNIEILLSKADVLVREPQIDSMGTTALNSFYGYGELYRQIGVLGSNLFVTGKTSFQADYSDKFTIISDLSINGKIIHSVPLYGYDELGSLINLGSSHIVLFAMVGVMLYFLSRYKIIPNRENTWFKL